ncbi:hypothetical protein PS6_011613 [Mucor atramentarius]
MAQFKTVGLKKRSTLIVPIFFCAVDLDRDPPPGITCYPKEDNITKLEAYIKGPPDTPYENGLFKLDMLVPNNYPFDPPQIRFVTRIYHPNIDDAGRICADILKKGDKGSWNPAMNLRTSLLSLAQLLAHPNPDDPLDAQIAREYQIDRPTFDQKALEFTLKFANEETVMSNNQDQEEKEAKCGEKVELKSEYVESKQEEEVAVETKPKLSLSLSKKKSSTGSSQTSTQQSSQSTQSSLASVSSFNRKKKQQHPEKAAPSNGHESTTLSKVHKSTPSTKAHKSAIDRPKSPEKSVTQIEKPETEESNVDTENNEALSDTHKDKIECRALAEKPEGNAAISNVEAKEGKIVSNYFTLSKAKTVPLSEQKPIKEVQVNVSKQKVTSDAPQQQKNTKKRQGNDIIVLSDDEDGRGVVHSLRLSKKLKRTTLSLSRQRK